MTGRNSNARLEEALTNLVNDQATLVANQLSFQANFVALTARRDKRFARIEAELAEIRPFSATRANAAIRS